MNAHRRILIALLGMACIGGLREPLAKIPQETIVIPDEPTCGECKVSLESVAMLGESAGPAMFASTTIFAAIGNEGHVYAHEFDAAENIRVFDMRGNLIDVIGRKGQGPGEFQSVAAVRVGPSGRVYAFDDLRQTISVFSPEHDFLESFVLPVRPSFNVVLISDSRVVLVQTGRGPNTAGYPLHLADISARAELVRSFGSDGRLTPVRNVRRVAGKSRHEGHVWTADADATEYRLEEWSITGELRRVLSVENGWFERGVAAAEPRLGEPRRFSEPAIKALYEDALGRLWVFTSVPDPGWENHLVDSPRGPRFGGTPNQGRDTVVEVIDLNGRVVIARSRVDQALMPVAEGIARSVEESVDGDIRLELLHVWLSE